MHYLTNYYKNLSEQLQEKVNFLESQLNEYLVRPGEKDGKKGTFYGPKFVPDEERKKDTSFSIKYITRDERNPKNPFGPPIGREGEEGYWEPDRSLVGPNYKPRDRWIPGKRKPAIDKSTGKPIKLFEPRVDKNPKPASPGIPMFPERKPLIGKVPMLGDTDAIDVMPEPDRDEINITPEFGQRGPIRPENKILKTTTTPREKIDFLDRVSEMPSSGTIPSNLKPISPGSKIYTPSELDLEPLPLRKKNPRQIG
jgi:hypothetical protein